MELSPRQRSAVFVVVVIALAALGYYLVVPAVTHAHGHTAASPAASPLPGRLLASEGPAGKWAALALLAVAVAVFAWWLARRPPHTARSAEVLLAAGLTAAVTLAPAARWGYYAYPLALLGWLRLSRPAWPCSYSSERALATPSASAVASPGGASTEADAVPASG